MEMEMLEHERQWLIDQGAKMITALGVKEDNSVIDFGCGKGRYTIPLAQVVGKNGNVLAIECDSNEVTLFHKRIAAFDVQGVIKILNSEDVQLHSVDDDTIDSVFAFDVLQYVKDWHSFFKSVRRVLKPGGSLHIYPATIPHPEAVDIKRVAAIINKIDLQSVGKKTFRMMHNKDMVNDEVYTFILPN